MRSLFFLFVLVSGISARAQEMDSLPRSKKVLPYLTVHFASKDSFVAQDLIPKFRIGAGEVFIFFQIRFPRPFDAYIFPDRKALTAQWRIDWKMPDFNSECWMVASGVAHRLDILSPRVWGMEACDHNGNDSTEVQQIITHEMIHVFHAQQHSNGSYEGMENLDWLIEGLAGYASGQLTESKLREVSAKLKSSPNPETLSDIWKGKLRYQQAASLVRFIDEKFGRDKLISLLKITSKEEILTSLQTSESMLMHDWLEYYK